MMNNCPVCDGEGTELGSLGYLVHYTCRDCGIAFMSPVEFKWDDDTTKRIAESLGLKKKGVKS